MIRIWMMGILSLLLMGCITNPSPAVTSQLQQGKHDFDQGYYRKALRRLLPLACGCGGNAQAQYAVGYMYYYGLGVAQDTDVGYFWIKNSADQKFVPAKQALQMIVTEQAPDTKKGAFHRIKEGVH